MVAMWIFGVIGIVLLFVLYVVWIFNRMVVLKNRIETAWSQIDVQLKKRYDLIPNLINTVKGYAKHEKTVFNEITKARTAAMKSKGVKDKAKSENMITEALKTVFAVAENYPKLRATENFQMLQEELSGIESKIAYARQFYNDQVLKYDNIISKFPGYIFARQFNFKQIDYFETKGVETKPVKVEF